MSDVEQGAKRSPGDNRPGIEQLGPELLERVLLKGGSEGLGGEDTANAACVSREWRATVGPHGAAVRALATPPWSLGFGGEGHSHLAALKVLSQARSSPAGVAAHERARIVAAKLEGGLAVVRGAALDALGLFGTASAPHLRQIVRCLSDEVPKVRVNAALVLGGLHCTRDGEDDQEDCYTAEESMLRSLERHVAAPHVGALAALLEDSQWSVRSAALRALRNLGQLALPYFRRVVARLRDDIEEVREEAWGFLEEATKDSPEGGCQVEVRESLREHSESVMACLGSSVTLRARRTALRVAKALSSALGTLAVHQARYVVDQMGDPSEDCRALATDTLQFLLGLEMQTEVQRTAQASAVHGVAELLRHDLWDVRLNALWVLGEAGEAAAGHVGEMAALLEDEDDDVRVGAEEMLGALGEVTVPQLQVVIHRLEHAEAHVRVAGLHALWNLGELAAPHALIIAARLHDADSRVRFAAASMLSDLNVAKQIAPEAMGCGIEAAEWMCHAQVHVRVAAVRLAYHDIGGPESYGDLCREIATHLDDAHWAVRWAALQWLAQLSRSAVSVAAEVVALLVDEELNVRIAAMEVLFTGSTMLHHLTPHMDAVMSRLVDQEALVRAEMLHYLLQSGSEGERLAAPYLQTIARMMADVDDGVRINAVLMLTRLAEHVAPYAVQVEARLMDAHWMVRGFAVTLLDKLRVLTPSQLTTLMAPRLKDEHEEVRRAALNVLAGLSKRHVLPLIQDVGDMLTDGAPQVRFAALTVLKGLGKRMQPCKKAVFDLAFLDTDDVVRGLAAELIGSLGTDALEFSRLVFVMTQKGPNPDCRKCSIKLLAKMTKSMHDAIRMRLQDEDEDVRREAETALGELRKTDSVAGAGLRHS
eukprot:gene1629-2272_t